jgi:hypothetical protein
MPWRSTCSVAPYHDGPCGPGYSPCAMAPNRIRAALRGGDEPDWPYVAGEYAGGLAGETALVAVPNWGDNTAYRFEVRDRNDVDALIKVLQAIREGLP